MKSYKKKRCILLLCSTNDSIIDFQQTPGMTGSLDEISKVRVFSFRYNMYI